jgi:hypothetical protein
MRIFGSRNKKKADRSALGAEPLNEGPQAVFCQVEPRYSDGRFLMIRSSTINVPTAPMDNGEWTVKNDRRVEILSFPKEIGSFSLDILNFSRDI